MTMSRRVVLAGLFFLVAGLTCASPRFSYAAPPDALANGFVAPPDSAKPHTWWHWMNGNVTREGITADLEAMKHAGIGGAQIFNVYESIPGGPVKFMSADWLGMTRYAAQEAHRLGLELCIHNCAGWSSSGGPWITPEYAMQKVVTSQQSVQGPSHFAAALPQPPKRNDYYRDIAVLAFKTPAGGAGAATIADLTGKADFERQDGLQAISTATAPADQVVHSDQIINLTERLGADGRLEWDVPAGQWTVLRLGYTPTGAHNAPAPPEGTGLECDKLSREAMDVHFNGMMQKVINELGPLAGQTLNNVLIDSYETGSQNWTAKFRDEFRRRRGYDLLNYLPVLSGRVVDSPEISDRFLWDFRKTIAELWTQNYYGRLAELCHQHGMRFSTEPYGNGPFEDLGSGGTADIPMGEFWVGGGAEGSCKLAAASGHIYGHEVIGAESFTAAPEHGRWTNDPYSLKALGDLIYTSGINRFIFHRYAMQPWLNRYPGMTMGQWGTHFDRTNTWWNASPTWMRYLARCQYLLQQGLFVADALYFVGENEPVGLRTGTPSLPPGYDYDGANRDVLLNRMSVRNGRIVLPSGISYRVLILPPDDTMTLAALRKISQLVADGATVIGPKPTRSPSLENYPQADAAVKTLADALWGNADGKTVTRHAFGRGVVIWGQPLEQVFAAMQLGPDFSYANPRRVSRLAYIHRAAGNADIYFVSNQKAMSDEVQCSFRISGKVPELWHPDTGRMEPAPLYTESNGRVTLPLRFDPAGSVFVLFRQPATRGSRASHFVAVSATTARAEQAPPMHRLEIRRAVYEAVDGTGSADVTAKVAAMVQDGMLSLDANNAAFGDPTPLHVKQLRVEYTLDGKPLTKVVSENGFLEIPDSAPRSGTPTYDLAVAPNGRVELRAWQPGVFQLKSATGRVSTISVRNVAAPQPVDGTWQLRFPPNWGAPPEVTLDKLISWSDHPDSGVKYFSGTATYTKEIVIPTPMLRPDRALMLDLGLVKNLAQVSLNGRDLGVLWKPPFRMDISGAAHPGANLLEVRITNLWPNRLIGDEQLPEDVKWAGKHLAEWPQWLLEGKPSPTGRYTFTTWHHYDKDSPLLESGLLGPVTLRGAEVITVR